MTALGEAATVLDQALSHRASLLGTTFVAVTGSCGKTTTKDLAAAVLAAAGDVVKTTGSNNCGDAVASDLLAVKQQDQYFVAELGAWGPGTLDAGIRLVRPRISVITNLRSDHYSAFHGPHGAQAEKGKLVRCLPADGVAVLNWDDERVRELGSLTAGRVFRFGRHPEAHLRAVDVTSRWPAPLTFRAIYDNRQVLVRSSLLGEHLLGSALAALAVGLVCGVSLDEAAAKVEAAGATDRRMTADHHSDGVTFIRDDFKSPAESIPEVLQFMRDAAVSRKVGVFGRISDFPGRSRTTYTQVAGDALAVLDAVVFVGRRSVELWGEQRSESPTDQRRLLSELGLCGAGGSLGKFFVFESVRTATEFLTGYLRAGDLVLLKGSGPTDHLERILLSRRRQLRCWAVHCGRTCSCDACDLLDRAAGDDVPGSVG